MKIAGASTYFHLKNRRSWRSIGKNTFQKRLLTTGKEGSLESAL
jgi:hypothetical protein